MFVRLMAWLLEAILLIGAFIVFAFVVCVLVYASLLLIKVFTGKGKLFDEINDRLDEL